MIRLTSIPVFPHLVLTATLLLAGTACPAPRFQPVTEPADRDGDGLAGDQDCDDQNPLRAAGLPERCDGVDNDCDQGLPRDEQDADQDGVVPCSPWEGEGGGQGGDCDDDDALRFPDNPEICDGIDNDCDSEADEGLSPDVDDDGSTAEDACNGSGDDCDDLDPLRFPSSPEYCDGIDNDCDDEVDEGSAYALVDRPLLLHGTYSASTGRRATAYMQTEEGGWDSLASPTIDGYWLHLTPTDLDADGSPDFMGWKDNRRLFWNRLLCEGDPDGDGVFTYAWGAPERVGSYTAPLGWSPMSSGMVDDDDVIDFVMVQQPSGNIRTLLGIAPTSESGPDIAELDSSVSFSHADREHWSIARPMRDHDGDGYLDIMGCGWEQDGGGTLCELLGGAGDGSFDSVLSTFQLPKGISPLRDVHTTSIAWGDVNNDGAPDLVYGGADRDDPGQVYLTLQQASGGWGPAREVFDMDPDCEDGSCSPSLLGLAWLSLADYTGDGDLDLIAVTALNSGASLYRLQIWEGSGTGQFRNEVLIETALPSSHAQGDDPLLPAVLGVTVD